MIYTKEKTQRRKIPYQHIICILLIICSIWIFLRIYNKDSVTINYPINGVGDKWLATDIVQILRASGYKAQFKHQSKIKPAYNIVLRGNIDNIKKGTFRNGWSETTLILDKNGKIKDTLSSALIYYGFSNGISVSKDIFLSEETKITDNNCSPSDNL